MGKRTFDDWRKSGDHLPDFLKDFHDQKDAFKTMHEVVNVEGHEYCKDISWVEGHCYIVDIFLWWAARYGYKLQKTSANVEFENLDDAISAQRDCAMNMLRQALSQPQ